MFANAESYERFMGRWSRLLAERLIDFTNVSDEGRVLDIGSGCGGLSFVVAQRKAKTFVIGVDPSKEYVGYANNSNPFPDRITFAVGDAQRLPFGRTTFKSSLSLLVFNFIPDPLKALEEARRVTEPEGVIAAAVWDYGGGMQMLRVFWDAAASLDDRAGRLDEARMRLCRSGELADLWIRAGLKDVHQQPLDFQMRFESFEDYWRPFLAGQGPAGAYVASLDSFSLHRLRSELSDRVSGAAEDSPVVLPARAWAVFGIVPAGL